MVVINGQQFNLTQIGSNKYLNNIKSAKEAQELAQLLRGLDREVTVIKKLGNGCSEQIVFNHKFDIYEQINDTQNPMYGTVDGQKVNFISVSKTDYAYDKDYTADDALKENWMYSTGKILFEDGYVRSSVKFGGASAVSDDVSAAAQNGRADATVKNDAVVGMSQGEFLDYVRENGLDREINWDFVNQNFKGSASFKDLTDYTDYAAALYASLEQRINSDYSGTEKQEQMELLNNAFNAAVDKLAEGYVENLTEVYDSFGVSLPENEISQSIKAVLEQKKESYRDFAAKNSDYANLSGSNDKWLERDMKYMANALRNAYSESEKSELKPAAANSGGFSENDLITLGVFANTYAHDAQEKSSIDCGFLFNEESLGFGIGLQYLAVMGTAEEMNASERVKELGIQLVGQYAEAAMDAGDAQEAVLKHEAIDRQAVYDVAQKMIDTFEESKDMTKAIHAGGNYGYNTYISKEKQPEYTISVKHDRYQTPDDIPEGNFWHEFYDDGRGTSFVGKTMDKMNQFMQNVKARNLEELSGVTSLYFMRNKTLVYGLYRNYY